MEEVVTELSSSGLSPLDWPYYTAVEDTAATLRWPCRAAAAYATASMFSRT